MTTLLLTAALLSRPVSYARSIDLDPVSGSRPTAAPALRWGFGGASPSELAIGSSANALLFGLSVLNAFAPSALPTGLRRAFRGGGRP